MIKSTKLVFLLIICLSLQACKQKLPPPNILWITCEDISPNLSVYGDSLAYTPNLDRLAREGVVYKNAFASAPVCAVARSSIISGLYASSQGTQHMRCRGVIPQEVKMYPEYLQAAGYYSTNNVKTDYNFEMDDKSVWDDCSRNAHWRSRQDPNQAFFSIFNFGTTHESRVNNEERYLDAIKYVADNRLKKPAEVTVPPYYPQTEAVETLMARYYNIITAMDMQVGELLQQLQEDGLAENTIIIFYSDHGAGIPRHKRWLYDSGLRVPMIVKIPEKYQNLLPHLPGSQTDELVSFIDLPPTALNLAKIPIPDYMEGRAFLGTNLSPPRDYIYAGRDRMDERYDMQRAVRDKRFKYIRYYEPYKPFCQYMNTPEKGAIMQALRQAKSENTLNTAGQQMMADIKPDEELFDCELDPWELNNLASDPAYQDKLEEMRKAHAEWSDQTKDTGLIPETILRKWEMDHQASIYDVMRTQDIPVPEIRKTALGELKPEALEKNLIHENEAVRYWAAINLANQVKNNSNEKALISALRDKIPLVRIAAARALCKYEQNIRGLKSLEQELNHEDEWVRLAAALVLDELGDQARGAIPSLKSVMNDTNKYVVRVANHALNNLLGTDNVVR